MANQVKNMDKIFQQKLENHEEKPSALAWERLENQLPARSRKNRGFLWAAAAVILVLLSVGALVWSSDSTIKKEELLASEEQNSKAISPSARLEQVETPETEENTTVTDLKSQSSTEQSEETEIPKTEKRQSPSNFKAPATNKLLAKAEKVTRETTEIPSNDRIIHEPLTVDKSLPNFEPLDSKPTIAELTPETQEEPAYTVTIRSDGLKENKGLIANLGKKVEQIEGFTEKVDLFANLQDAKNNLFASLTSKKERGSENP